MEVYSELCGWKNIRVIERIILKYQAMNASVKECGICKEEFDEEARCPRNFQCFHSFCTYCIEQLIKKKTKMCPFCRKEFKANKADDVMINHTMLELITLQKTNSKRVRESEDTPRKKRLSKFMEELKGVSIRHHDTCKEERSRIKNLIEEVSNMQEDIKQENIRIQKIISQNTEKVEELDNTKKALHIQLNHLKEKDKAIEDVKMKVDTCTAGTFKACGPVIDEVEETNTAIGEWIEEFKRRISEDEKTVQTIKKKFSKTKDKFKIILEDLSSPQETDGVKDSIPGTSARRANQDKSLPLTIKTLREMSARVKNLVKQGKVFAVQEHEGRRSGRISITDDNRLCLHHLREEPLPSNVHIVTHGDVMRLLDPSSRLTFIELGDIGGSTLGRLYIRLSGDTKRAQHFSFLCTGEMGPSYAHTNILWVVDKGSDNEFVVGGDYESNDGGGGMALLEGIEEEDRQEYLKPCLAGTVLGGWSWSEATAAQFIINTRNNPEKKLDATIGMVEEGLSVLTEAISRYPDIKDVSIKDCGIVLPL